MNNPFHSTQSHVDPASSPSAKTSVQLGATADETLILYRKVLSACPYCDLVIKRHHMETNQYSICPRCHSKVEHKHDNSRRFLYLTVFAALLFYFPANFYPLITVNITGSIQNTSVFNGIVMLVQQEQFVTAAMVFYCSIVVPTLIILLFSCLLLCRLLDSAFTVQKYCVRVLVLLRNWSMLDIYLLSFFVSAIKVRDIGEIQLEVGLLAFIGLTLCINKLFISYDKRALWQLITKDRQVILGQ